MPQKLRCRVEEIIDHGGQVYSLTLIPERVLPRFLPGQFLHLALDEYNPGDFWPESRIFSIASPASQRDRLRITYAVKGVFTRRMEKELIPDRQVWVKLPYGEFIVEADYDNCLLAGGTGITAFTAYLAGLDADQSHRVALFYGARKPDLLIYRPLVDAATAVCPKLDPFFLIEDGRAKGCEIGRIDLERVWKALHDPADFIFYLSGPPAMLRSLSEGLALRGIPERKIRMDAWE